MNLLNQSGSTEDENEPQDLFDPADSKVQTDELDFLFDGPTQQLSAGALSQPLTEPAEPAPPSGPVMSIAFEDDWDDDDFLNDSLVIEMTQNPLQQSFTAPKFCSTQNPLGLAGEHTGGTLLPAGTRKSDLSSSVRKDQEESQQNQFSPVRIGSLWTQQGPKEELLTAVWSQPAPSDHFQSEPDQSQSFWDDPADDYLLCEVCEDLENRIVAAEQIAAPSKNRRPPPASIGSTLDTRTMVKVASKTAGMGSSSAGGPCFPQSIQRGPFTFKKPSGPVSIVTSQGETAPDGISTRRGALPATSRTIAREDKVYS